MDFTESNDTDVTTDDVISHGADEPEVKPMFLTPEQVMFGADIMIGVCVLVNVLLLVTVFSSRRLRRGATAGLVVTLTVSNILTVVSGKVILEVMWLYEMEPVADVLCKAGSFLDSMLTTTSMFILVAVAYDHYVAVCRPLSLQKRGGNPLTQGIIRAALCALVAALLAWPQIFINRMVDDYAIENITEAVDTNETTTASSLDYDYVTPNNDSADPKPTARYCEPDPPAWLEWYGKSQVAVYIVVSYIVPMTIIFILYGYTASTLMNSGTLDRRRNQDKQRKDRSHAAKSLIGLAFINLVVMLPMNVLILIYDYKLVANEYLQELAYVALYTYVTTCMINAIMVYVLSQKHRAQLIKILTCAIFRQRSGMTPQSLDRTNSSQLTLQSKYRMQRLKSTGADEYDSHSTSNITTSSKY